MFLKVICVSNAYLFNKLTIYIEVYGNVTCFFSKSQQDAGHVLI